jgi:hypothetical protein
MSVANEPAHTENGWDGVSEQQVRTWVRTAQLNSAINELAALYYTKLYKIALLVVSVLTIIVGSRGIATLITEGITAADITISICEILLGIFASLLSNMELKNKSVSFSKRASGYSKLANMLRVQMVLRPEERQHKVDLLQGIPEKVEYLDDMAEPLPLRYRELAERSTNSILNLWSRTADTPRAAATVHPMTSAVYDSGQDVEGGIAAIVRTIIGQRL